MQAALKRAAEDAATPFTTAPASGVPRTRHLAIGDPQAPLATFLEILDRRGLLDADTGRIAAHCFLVSIGDHFDWGGAARRDDSTRDGLHLLAWLAAHPVDQVTVIAGNHDLARVGELWRFDDASFAEARAEADAAYLEGKPRRSEEEFRRAWDLPSWEVAARDFSGFCAAQRTLVASLLRAGRLRLAQAFAPGVLLSHAGLTSRDLEELGVERTRSHDAAFIARQLQARFDAAALTYEGGRFVLPPLYLPGDAEREGDGMLFHRAGKDAGARRFHPRDLPVGLTQAIGHVRDAKTRLLLGIEGAAADGPLRTLRVSGDTLDYQFGVGARGDATSASMVFLDGGMLHARPADYQLLDLDAWAPA